MLNTSRSSKVFLERGTHDYLDTSAIEFTMEESLLSSVRKKRTTLPFWGDADADVKPSTAKLMKLVWDPMARAVMQLLPNNAASMQGNVHRGRVSMNASHVRKSVTIRFSPRIWLVKSLFPMYAQKAVGVSEDRLSERGRFKTNQTKSHLVSTFSHPTCKHLKATNRSCWRLLTSLIYTSIAIPCRMSSTSRQ